MNHVMHTSLPYNILNIRSRNVQNVFSNCPKINIKSKLGAQTIQWQNEKGQKDKQLSAKHRTVKIGQH